jgi:asparagine synthase (glutamine-hydrolysing)
MAETLKHRGPDEQRVFLSPGGRCAFGHARLRVIDLETGAQPMPNEDGSVQVVFNGEIYNFRELRRELEGRGHRFRTQSDTEVVVHGFEEWGPEVCARLDGMFAFAAWNEREGTLTLGRDRAGQKPLFVYERGDTVAFASEMKALRTLPVVDRSIDEGAVPLYLAYGYVPSPRTLHRHIRKLPPGTWMRFGADGPAQSRPYWQVSFGCDRISPAEALEEVRRLTREAVERRLVSDVPLGAFLSGGIDSSIVVGLMSRMVDEPVRTFSIGFEGDPNYDETAHARVAAEAFGTRHTEFVVGPGEIRLLDDLVEAYDEPFGDSSAIPTSIVSRLTREHVTVALTGDGGDEIFAGYPRFLGNVLADVTPGLVIGLGRRLGGLLPHDSDFRSPTRRFQRFMGAAALPAEDRMLRWIGFFSDRLDTLLRPELRGLASRDALVESFSRAWRRRPDTSCLSRTLQLNFETYLLDDLLVKADRCSMMHSLELRSPFLDTALIEFASRLPDRMRIRGRTLKHALREAFRDLLPGSLLTRGKMGFGVPLPTWFRTHWRPLLEERLLPPGARIYEWLERDPVVSMVDEHLGERADFGHQLWALLTLETWLEKTGDECR